MVLERLQSGAAPRATPCIVIVIMMTTATTTSRCLAMMTWRATLMTPTMTHMGTLMSSVKLAAAALAHAVLDVVQLRHLQRRWRMQLRYHRSAPSRLPQPLSKMQTCQPQAHPPVMRVLTSLGMVLDMVVMGQLQEDVHTRAAG